MGLPNKDEVKGQLHQAKGSGEKGKSVALWEIGKCKMKAMRNTLAVRFERGSESRSAKSEKQ